MPGLALPNRFASFKRLLKDTEEFIAMMPSYTKRDGAAIIYAFNSLFDISWKMMKDALVEWYGLNEVKPSPRDVINEAGNVGLIDSSADWLAMLKNRNLSTHDYMSINHEHYCGLITQTYIPLIKALEASVAPKVAELEAEESEEESGK